MRGAEALNVPVLQAVAVTQCVPESVPLPVGVGETVEELVAAALAVPPPPALGGRRTGMARACHCGTAHHWRCHERCGRGWGWRCRWG